MAAYNGPPDAVDYSFSRADIAKLVAAHIKLVCRYLSHTNGKNLSASEARALLAAGIGILLNWESSADRARQGYAAGVADGRDAAALAKSFGAPRGCIIYFSVDFQPTASQLAAVGEYIRGCRDGLAGYYGTGAYGNDAVVDYLHAHGLTTAEWQTYAWSGGRLSPEADLYQYLNGQTLAGASVDFDKIIHPAVLGAWWPAGHAPAGSGTPIGDEPLKLDAEDRTWLQGLVVSSVHGILDGTIDRIVSIEKAVADDTIALRAASYVGGAIPLPAGWNLPGLFAQVQKDLGGTKDRVATLAAQPAAPTAVDIEAVVRSAVASVSGSDPAAIAAAVTEGVKALAWRAA